MQYSIKKVRMNPDAPPDPTKQPEKNDPTRINDPVKNDPVRIVEPPPNKPDQPVKRTI